MTATTTVRVSTGIKNGLTKLTNDLQQYSTNKVHRKSAINISLFYARNKVINSNGIEKFTAIASGVEHMSSQSKLESLTMSKGTDHFEIARELSNVLTIYKKFHNNY